MRIRRSPSTEQIARRQAAAQQRRTGDGGRGAPPWLTLAGTLPGVVALVGLFFTYQSVEQTRAQLKIAEQGQITTRFNQAVTHLASDSQDVRFGGIYALERIMQDSPRDQPRIMAVLSAYMRTRSPVPTDSWEPMETTFPYPVDTDIAAAAEVLAERPRGKDGREKINWNYLDLRGMELQARRRNSTVTSGDPSAAPSFSFAYAKLNHADLRQVIFMGVDLSDALAYEVNLENSALFDVKFVSASMPWANLTRARLRSGTTLALADLSDAKLVDAELIGVDLTKADLGPVESDETDKTGADLTRANLTNAYLGPGREGGAGANLTGATLVGANLTHADLTNANLTNANLTNANLTNANLTKANLTGAIVTKEQLAQAKTYDGATGLPPNLP
ncbi:pentapeptide repeat-containing protein [Streptomyces sp. IBSNAI002]|uniref:pentapeptide repeat-containing protein n=1 Tax=Streptomyces sp. IBSNAI002 TaxID=3457500 RepID=UPI003FD51CA4